MKHLLPLLFIVLLSAGCHRENPLDKTLIMAEQLMDDRPDTVLTVLEAIDPQAITDQEQRALYALLLTQARNKNYIDEVNDSLISTAVTYFGKHRNKSLLQKALFYQAAIQYYAQDYARSIVSAMKANELSQELEDDYWLGRTYRLMADIYDKTYYRDAVAGYLRNAAHHYGKSNKVINQYHALLNEAIAYTNAGNYARSLELIDSIYDTVSIPPLDSTFAANCLSASLMPLFYSERYEEVGKRLHLLRKFENYYSFNAQDYAYAAEISIIQGDLNHAHILVDSVYQLAQSESEKVDANVALMNLLKQEKRHEEVAVILDTLLNQQNRVVNQILKQAVVSAQRDFYNDKSEEAELHAKKVQFTLLLASAVFLIILGLGLLLYKYRMRLKEMEMENHMNEILSLSEEIRNKDNDYIRLLSKLDSEKVTNESQRLLIEKLFKEQFHTINMLCDEYFEQEENDRTNRLLYRRIKNEVMKVAQPESLKKIEGTLNNCMDEIIRKLREQFPQFKSDDITLLIFIYAGFAPRSICLFMDMKLKTFYTKRSRLKERMASSKASDKDWLVAKMG